MDALLEEIEQESVLRPRKYTSAVNQPNLIAINSANAIRQGEDSYSTFTVNLPRPILQAETIQLVNANIPQCVPNIPDNALVFWYYRLSEYNGKTPSLNNLHCVRLLPSYYRPEFMEVSPIYGMNRTFHDYTELESQLTLACEEDVAYNFYTNDSTLLDYFKPQFTPKDIDIFYQEDINKFRVRFFNAYNPPAFREWNAGFFYSIGARVYFNAPLPSTQIISYTCLQPSNGNDPRTNPAFWLPDNLPITAPYSATTSYGVNRYVSFFDGTNNGIYKSILPTLNNLPTNTTFWIRILTPENPPADEPWNRYLLTGYDDPNVIIAQNSFFQPYDATTLFEANTTVEYQGQFYKTPVQTVGSPIPAVGGWTLQSSSISKIVSNPTSVTVFCDNSAGLFVGGSVVFIADTDNNLYNSINTQDPSVPVISYTVASATPTSVTLIFAPNGPSLNGRITLTLPRLMGIHAFSNQFDFNIANGLIPVGIPPQPFSVKPLRILNTILGFTFNGVFNKSTLTNITPGDINLIETVNTNLFNRLRPVPPYFVNSSPPLLLGSPYNPPALSAQIYTAEGYANLVYSSIISIYASAVGGSTLDTQDNTNLIAQGTMNCGNLGVSFFAPYVEIPLLIGGEDIYTLSFTLKDECNDDYVLTNNAVVSLVLKATYKK